MFSQVRLPFYYKLKTIIFTTPGSVLSVWTKVESVLTNDGQKKGQHAKMQVGLLLTEQQKDSLLTVTYPVIFRLFG